MSNMQGSVQAKQGAVHSTQWLAVTAVLMAMNVGLSSFGVPVPGGHLYLNDVVICTAGILLDPLGAFMVGGVGAFFRRLFLLSYAYVCILSHPWNSGSGDFPDFPSWREGKADGGILSWGGRGSRDYGSGVFPGQGIYLQHAGICAVKAAVPDFAGGGWSRGGDGDLLSV